MTNPRDKDSEREPGIRLYCKELIYCVCPFTEYKDISVRTGLSARRKTDKKSHKGDSAHKGL